MTQNNSEILNIEFYGAILAFCANHGDDIGRWYNMAEIDVIFFVGSL